MFTPTDEAQSEKLANARIVAAAPGLFAFAVLGVADAAPLRG